MLHAEVDACAFSAAAVFRQGVRTVAKQLDMEIASSEVHEAQLRAFGCGAVQPSLVPVLSERLLGEDVKHAVVGAWAPTAFVLCCLVDGRMRKTPPLLGSAKNIIQFLLEKKWRIGGLSTETLYLQRCVLLFAKIWKSMSLVRLWP